MEKNKKFIKVLKFLLQILVTILTSWGTASGVTSSSENSVQTPVHLGVDHPTPFS